MSAAPIVVVGGGPAGATAATLLARAGRDVLVLERAAGPVDKVCGDFLSGEAAQSLRALGVDLPALTPAPIRRVRLVAGRRVAEAALPFPAWGLTRRALDEAVLTVAQRAGADVRRGVSARGLHEIGGARASVDCGAGRIDAASVLLATGKHDLRGWGRPSRADADLIGFKTYYSLLPAQAAALAGHIEIVLFDGGYAGLQPVEGGRANLCLVVSRGAFARAGGEWDSFLSTLVAGAPHLARRLEGAAADRAKPLAISAIPYGFVHRGSADGVFRLGDQAAVIPSLTGDGVAIALHTGRVAAHTLLDGGDARTHHARLRNDLAGQIGRAMWAHRLVRRPALQPALVAACAAAPAAMRAVARLTRVPDAARARAAV